MGIDRCLPAPVALRKGPAEYHFQLPRCEFAATVMDGSAAVVSDPEILAALGQALHPALSLRRLWTDLLEAEWSAEMSEEFKPLLQAYAEGGTLAERMVTLVGLTPTREELMRLLRCQRASLVKNHPISVGL